eukprot:g3277.t1
MSARKQSVVSKREMEATHNELERLFKTFADDDDLLNQEAFAQLVEEAGFSSAEVGGKELTTPDVILVYTRAKVGRANGLRLERFEEAVRMMATQKGVTYQELVPRAAGVFKRRMAQQQRFDVEAAVKFTVELSRGSDRGLGVVLYIEEELPNRLRVDEVNPDSAAGRYNAAVDAENAEQDAAEAASAGGPLASARMTLKVAEVASETAASGDGVVPTRHGRASSAHASAAAAVAAVEDGDELETDDDEEDEVDALAGVAASATRREQIAIGDYVTEVNGMEVEGQPLLEVLEEMRKPTLRLTFLRLRQGGAGEGGADGDPGPLPGGAGGAGGTAPGSALKCQWLMKQGHIVKSWKRRWFVIRADAGSERIGGGCTLEYYSQETDMGGDTGTVAKGTFPLEPPGTVAEQRGLRSILGGEHELWQFALHNGKRMLLMGAPDKSTMNRWVGCLNQVVQGGAAAAERWAGEGLLKRGASSRNLPPRRGSLGRHASHASGRADNKPKARARMSLAPLVSYASEPKTLGGWLWKEGEGTTLHARKKRWFQLTEDRLTYFTDATMRAASMKGEIALNSRTSLMRQVAADGGGAGARIEIITERRVYVLYTDDGSRIDLEGARAATAAWVEAIGNNLSLLKRSAEKGGAATEDAKVPLSGGLAMSGSLWKVGRRRANWKQRWFELCTPPRVARAAVEDGEGGGGDGGSGAGKKARGRTTLRYYVGRGGKQKGEFDLSTPPIVAEELGQEEDEEEGGAGGQLWRFQVRSRSRTLLMAAQDEATMHAWVQALRTAIFAGAGAGARFQRADSGVTGVHRDEASISSAALPLGMYRVKGGQAEEDNDGINSSQLGVAYCL